MHLPRFLLAAALAGALACLALPANAEMIGGNPGPRTTTSARSRRRRPNRVLLRLSCILRCASVKSIEIIEFGYAKATEGTNGAKAVLPRKQRQNMVKPYQAAMRDAAIRNRRPKR
jgi:hypothetical protein